MEKLKKTRAVARTAFTRASTTIRQELLVNPPRTTELNVAFKLLESRAKELEESQKNLVECLLDSDATEEEIAVEMESGDEYKTRYLEDQIKVEMKLSTQHVISQQNCIQPANNIVIHSEKRNYTLPRIELKKFSGDLKEWLQFWSQFKKIHEDQQLSKSDKFYYLNQSMVPGSRASELVNSYPETEDNYEKVIESLKSRFGKDTLLVEVYVRELLTLVLNNAANTGRKIQLATLYDKLETQIRALESLGVTTDTCAAMLYPLVESSMPEELLRIWQRQVSLNNAMLNTEVTRQVTFKDRLTSLMMFLNLEVENDQRIAMAMNGFGLNNTLSTKTKTSMKKVETSSDVATASTLFNAKENKTMTCIFCSGKHNSQTCEKAKKMTLQERQNLASEKSACFDCLDINHIKRKCRSNVKCGWCGRRHALIMCRSLPEKHAVNPSSIKQEEKVVENNMANISLHSEVFLQTIQIKLCTQQEDRVVRAILDTGSHRSYVLKSLVEDLNLEEIGQQNVVHLLFGGRKTKPQKHKGYKLSLKSMDNVNTYDLVALDEEIICLSVPSVGYGPWLKELQNKNIRLSDIDSSHDPISILIGADAFGELLTGNIYNLACGATAIETRLGWSLIGKKSTEEIPRVDSVLTVMSMYIQDAKVADLWSLDILGITDPAQRKSKEFLQEKVKEKFRETVKVDDTGRFEVMLPWKDSHPPLPDNKVAALKRLHTTTRRLELEGYREDYQRVFDEWLQEGIIEKVSEEDVDNQGYYLPHHHVIKVGSTTPIRPVFDASAKLKNEPSLNQCLETGPNLIELIPTILLRFREKKIGVISDIKKAFLQIGLSPEDRDVLRFLWWKKSTKNQVEVFRHRRVVFGVSSSPFLLGATIELLLEQTLLRTGLTELKEVIIQLLKSFYVDNCVTSVDSKEELENFIIQATAVMNTGCFNLRGWEYTGEQTCKPKTSVLGMVWDKEEDVLMLGDAALEESLPNKITKRVILSSTHKVFDPMGVVCPVLLCPKLLLQRLWATSIDWDTEVPEDVKNEFFHWHNELVSLKQVKIPRWAFGERLDEESLSFHVFVDASQDAYAAVIFVRTETLDGPKVQLLEAKSRVAPVEDISIPRLELLAATVGARLMNQISKILGMKKSKIYYWSDSTTVLTWIQQGKQWATFVYNRVEEIRQITDTASWRHIPGIKNPADMPSRGCSAKQLVESQWWLGPDWLKRSPDFWPISEYVVDEAEVKKEVKKSAVRAKEKVLKEVVLLQTNNQKINLPWYMEKFSSYLRIVRSMAWIERFRSNCRKSIELKSGISKSERVTGALNTIELKTSELTLMRLTQEESFDGVQDIRIRNLLPFKDETGVIRLKTLIANREDKYGFRNPVVLDPKHPLVIRLIEYHHKRLNHAGIQIMMNQLREEVWILTSRRAIRAVIDKCVICRRHRALPMEVIPAVLPEPRIRDAAIFEISGVDLAGPVYLKGRQKAWICLFTCAVYRAIHLELVTSLSTVEFLEAFRRFIARRGRPSIMYSDNGLNFNGSNTKLKEINWDKINEYSSINKIDWRFNPPSAAWWGGWWERLVRSVKELLRKVLKKACLTYQEMSTTLCDCEAIINSRPLTYVSEDSTQLIPLTPAMFLQEVVVCGVPDLDQIDESSLRRRYRYRQKLREQLRRRFRIEYLGQLSRKNNCKKDFYELREGDVVLVGNDNTKRLDWPLARITKLIPGKDGHVRVVKLKTEIGELVRPIQRLYPLEMTWSKEVEDAEKRKKNF